MGFLSFLFLLWLAFRVIYYLTNGVLNAKSRVEIAARAGEAGEQSSEERSDER